MVQRNDDKCLWEMEKHRMSLFVHVCSKEQQNRHLTDDWCSTFWGALCKACEHKLSGNVARVWSQQVHKSVGRLWLTGTVFVCLPVVIGFILSHQGTQSLSRRMLSLYWELLDSKLLWWLVLFFFSFFCHGYWLSPAEAFMCLLCSTVVFFACILKPGARGARSKRQTNAKQELNSLPAWSNLKKELIQMEES